jgi:hypothetical protein
LIKLIQILFGKLSNYFYFFIIYFRKGSGFKGTGAVEAIKFIRQQVAP